jgi:predicted PurR-regulated permease PerM
VGVPEEAGSKLSYMSTPLPRKILIPRWVQLVGLPLLVLGAWRVFEVVNHAVFVFVVAALIAILLNPIVRAFCAMRIPRGLAVLIVYVCAALVVSGLTVLAGTVVAREVSSVAARVENEFVRNNQGVIPAEQKLNRLQHWIDTSSPVRINVKAPGERAIHGVDSADLQRYSGRAVSIAQSLVITVFESLFNLVLVIVISVYMLLDAPRLSRYLRNLFPGTDPSDDLVTRAERALLAYVRGQTLVSLVIGLTAGIGMEFLGLIGVFPSGSRYALAFGVWTALTEVIPYVGPWLGALLPAAVAATQSITAVLAVGLVYLFIHQIEGHIVIPKLMGGAVKVHPLVVIFALLAGGELYGVPGVLVTMPLVAIGREVGMFLRERMGLESWRDVALPLSIGLEPADQPEPEASAPERSPSSAA